MDDFELFKSECLKWIEFFGLKNWELIFEQASLGETRWARLSYDASACIAKFQFNSDPLTSIIHRRDKAGFMVSAFSWFIIGFMAGYLVWR